MNRQIYRFWLQVPIQIMRVHSLKKLRKWGKAVFLYSMKIAKQRMIWVVESALTHRREIQLWRNRSTTWPKGAFSRTLYISLGPLLSAIFCRILSVWSIWFSSENWEPKQFPLLIWARIFSEWLAYFHSAFQWERSFWFLSQSVHNRESKGKTSRCRHSS